MVRVSNDLNRRDDSVEALTRLARLARRRPKTRPQLRRFVESGLRELAESVLEVALETGDPVGLTLREILERTRDPALENRLLERLELARYRGSLPLQELAILLLEQILERDEAPSGDDPDRLRALRLHSLARRRFALGRWESAIDAAQASARDFRRLAERDRPGCRARLAEVLVLLGQVHGSTAEPKRAEEAAREAVDILREFPGLEVLLAQALVAWSEALSDLERPREALDSVGEALRLLRELVRRDPLANTSSLAGALIDQGIYRAALGEFEKALESTEEATEHLDKLGNERPDLAQPAHARALHGLGNRLDRLGRPHAALEATRSAVDLRRELSRARPDTFRADLARSLHTLGARLGKLGRHDEALDVTLEALGHVRELATRNPETFSLSLAETLDNLGNRQALVESFAAAIESTREAVEIWDRLAKREPTLHASQRSRVRINLGARLAEHGRHAEAVDVTREAISLVESEEERGSRALASQLMSARGNVAQFLVTLRRYEEALDAVDAALREARLWHEDGLLGSALGVAEALETRSQIYRALGRMDEATRDIEAAWELVESTPDGEEDGSADRTRFHLAMASGALSLDRGRPATALASFQRAERLSRRDEVAAGLERSELAALQRDMGATLVGLGRNRLGLEHTDRALKHFEYLESKAPGAFALRLGEVLINRANAIHRLGDSQEAVEQAERAVECFRAAARSPRGPAGVQQNLGQALGMLGALRVSAGCPEEAIEPANRSVRLLQGVHETHPGVAVTKLLAACLVNQGLVLDANSLGREALDASNRAVALLEPLARSDPSVFELELACVRLNRGALWIRLSEYGRAVPELRSALEVYGDREADQPEIVGETSLARERLGVALARLGAFDEAAKHFTRLVADSRARAETGELSDLADLATHLRSLGACQERTGDLEAALSTTEEAVAVARRLEAMASDEFGFLLAMALGNLAAIRAQLGAVDLARSLSREALERGEALADRLGAEIQSWLDDQRRQHALYGPNPDGA